jgi:hypothetical protein
VSREERLGENEVLYREVNERVRELQEGFELADDRVDFVCECARLDCTERIAMSVAEYRRLRASPVTFAVVPGHQIPDIESVVEERDGYVVIEKEGVGVEIAAEHDPRS